MKTTDSPICDAIENFISIAKLRGHMPGHRGGENISHRLADADIFTWDVTENYNLGNMALEEGPVYESEILSSKLHKVRRTLYLTQGSTSGIQTSLLVLRKHHTSVLVPRNAHLALLHSIVLSGLEPVWYEYELDKDGLFETFNLATLEELIKNNSDVKALFVQNPTYDGKTGDVEALVRLCKDNGITLVVDEAHGAHWHLSDLLPLSAAEAGADMVIQSAHKTLPALTGAAFLHINNEALLQDAIDARRLIQSTSPSYLIMASMDSLIDYAKHQAQEAYEELYRQVLSFYDRVKHLENIRLQELAPNKDFTKLLIVFSADMEKVAKTLIDYGIMVEKKTGNTALILLAPYMTEEEWGALVAALTECNKLPVNGKKPVSSYEVSIPEQVVPVRIAYFAAKEFISLEEAIGRICARAITIMPPCVPLIIPGEKFSEETVRSMLESSLHTRLTGVDFSKERPEVAVLIEKN